MNFCCFLLLCLLTVPSVWARSDHKSDSLALEVATEAECACYNVRCPSGYSYVSNPSSVSYPSTSTCCKRDVTCSTYTCPSPWIPKNYPSGIACASSTCQAAECCDAPSARTCSSYSCPSTMQPAPPTTICYSCGGCTQSTCCTAYTTCSSIQCNSQDTRTATTTCSGRNCVYSDCCQARPSCATWQCRTGVRVPTASCGCSGCSDSICCTVRTCCGYTCSSGLIPKSDSSIRCNTTCSDSECCNPTCALFQCPSGYISKTSAKNLALPCGLTNCQQNIAQCCLAKTCQNSGPAFCLPNQVPVSPLTKACTVCDTSECCQAQTVVCTGFSCGTGWLPKAGTITCPTGTCDRALCCLPSCSAQSQNLCSATRPAKSGGSSIQCAGSTCTVDECCLETCASREILCRVGFQQSDNFNRNVPCSGTGCSESFCCSRTCIGYTCRQGYRLKDNAGSLLCGDSCSDCECCQPSTCPANFACQSGTYLKPTYSSAACAGATCTNAECCLPYKCTTVRCPSGLNRGDYSTRTCTTQCTQSDCCLSQCPSNFQCDKGYTLKSPLPICSGSQCTNSDCCKVKTCASTTCPIGWQNTDLTKVCTDCDTECCSQLKTGCTTAFPASCPSGFARRPDWDSVACTAVPGCQLADCCLPTCLNYQCSAGLLLGVSPSSTVCPSGSCTDNICCRDTCASADVVCRGGFTTVASPDQVPCPSSGCSDSLCCRATCASYTCSGSFHAKDSSQTILCNGGVCSDLQCCDSNLCTADVCKPGTHLIVPTPVCSSWPCPVTDFENECCTADLCVNFPCPQGSTRNLGVACQAGGCTEARCCTPITCSSFTCPTWWIRNHDQDQTACPLGNCTPNLCCSPVCDSLMCTEGWLPKTSTSPITCSGSACTLAECCNRVTCADYTCKDCRNELNPDAQTTACQDDQCTDQECCRPIKVYCFDSRFGGISSCPVGWTAKGGAASTLCPNQQCGRDDCCSPTCASYDCHGLSHQPSSDTLLCTAGTCSDAQCCINTCDSFVCGENEQRIASKPCDEWTCTHDECCQARCISITCPQGTTRSVDSSTLCSGPSCTQDFCCKPLTCGSFPCTDAWHPKPGMQGLPCAGFTCQESDCCDRDTCADFSCAEGTTPKLGDILCVADNCTNDECCTSITCQNGNGNNGPFDCQGYERRSGFETRTCRDVPCTLAECCTSLCPAVSAPTVCAPGFVPDPSKADVTLCAQPECTNSECCQRQTCASFTSCPPNKNPVSDSSKTCDGSVCTEAECCVERNVGCSEFPQICSAVNQVFKDPASGNCPNQICTPEICCDQTCKNATLGGLCGQRPIKDSAASLRCPGGSCFVEQCCGSFCTTNEDFLCPAGQHLRTGADSIVCGDVCDTATCCTLDLCTSFECPSGFVSSGVSECLPGGCTSDRCCVPTCTSYLCPPPFVAVSSSADTPCPDGLCTTGFCCEGTCQDITCPSGFTDLLTKSNVSCGSEACEVSDCCSPNCAISDFHCPENYVLKGSPATIVCSGPGTGAQACSRDVCCSPVCSAAVSCAAGFQFDVTTAGKICSGLHCSSEECCQAKTCANTGFVCPDHWTPKQTPDVCGASCSNEICCDIVPPTCFSAESGLSSCPTPYVPKPNAETTTCHSDGNVCSRDECCQLTCTGFDCSALGRPVNVGASDEVCESGTCNPDVCCGQYCSSSICQNGLELNSPTQVCPTSGCTAQACCHSTCSNHECGTGWAPKAQPPIRCTNDVCTNDQCCDRKTCPATCPSGQLRNSVVFCNVCDSAECCKTQTCENYCCDGIGLDKPNKSNITCNIFCSEAQCCDAVCMPTYVCDPGTHLKVLPVPNTVRCASGIGCRNDECCVDNTCQTFPCPFGTVRVQEASSITCNPSCQSSDCCQAQSATCFASDSGLTQCPANFVPRPGTIECAGTVCGVAECCLATCAIQQPQLCAGVQANPALAGVVCSQPGDCQQSECCQQTCAMSEFLCPAPALGWRNADDYDTHVCTSWECTQAECCARTCQGFTCSTETHLKPLPELRPCPTGNCTNDICCVPTTCDRNSNELPFVCPKGTIPKPSFNGAPCLSGTCSEEVCCLPATCPAAYNCSGNKVPKENLLTVSCPETVCRDEDCCEESCVSWTAEQPCPFNMHLISQELSPCPDHECSVGVCCAPNLCSDQPYQCSAGWNARDNFATAPCGDICTDLQCCEQVCPEIFSCSPGFHLKPSPTTISCGIGAPCNETICCERNNCADIREGGYMCSDRSKYTLKPNQEEITCSGAFCTDAECCTGTCSGYDCGANAKPIAPFPTCATLACTQQECCQPLPKCPSDFQCGPNQYVITSLPTCAELTCTAADCCADKPTCPATYNCPSGWRRTSPSPVCPVSGCTDSDCCTPLPTCPVLPLFDCGEGFTNKQNPGPCLGAACTKSDCCVANTCALFAKNIDCGNGAPLAGTTPCDLCNALECCSPPKNCLSFTGTCPSGSVPVHQPAEKQCPSTGCTATECCCPHCNECGLWADNLIKAGKSTCPRGGDYIRGIDCGMQACSTSICCKTSTCINMNCPNGLSEDAAGMDCYHPENTACPNCCTPDDCCA